jgi:hypothetical protein
VSVFIKCSECGDHTRFDKIPATMIELALFRGSENPIVKCKSCHADMDTMKAFCGTRKGSEIVRHEDPKA